MNSDEYSNMLEIRSVLFPSYRIPNECIEDIRKRLVVIENKQSDSIIVYLKYKWEEILLQHYLSQARKHYILPKFSFILDALNEYDFNNKFDYYFNNYIKALDEERNYYFCKFKDNIPVKWQIETALKQYNVEEQAVRFFCSSTHDYFDINNILHMDIRELVEFISTIPFYFNPYLTSDGGI